MSRLHRAVEKADREGLLQWTRRIEQGRDTSARRETTAIEEPPAAEPAPEPPAPEPSAAPASANYGQTERGAQEDLERRGAAATGSVADRILRDDAQDLVDAALSPLLVAATEPLSPAAEQYRLLRTRLETRDATRRTQLLLVTSPKLGDGKTTTSANLALTMAREFQHQVVLVEADLRRPALAARFGLTVTAGLIDVLLGAISLDEAIVPVPGHNLSLLPAGAEGARSTELLASSMMERTADELRRRFDRVIVDTPPVVLADTQILARLADGILVVVRAGVTSKPSLERALASIDRERLLGIVLNEVDDAAGEYYPGLDYSLSTD